MTQRILRTIPAALLMTTALAWSLPSAAQTAGSAAPARTASATHSGNAAGGALGRTPSGGLQGGTTAPAGGNAAGGTGSGGGTLPPGFVPAEPPGTGAAPATATPGTLGDPGARGATPAPSRKP